MSNKYEILDTNGNTINTIIADEDFVITHYKNYRLVEAVDKKLELSKKIRLLRNKLLDDTDWLVIYHTEKGTNIPMEWEVYRQALRDVPSQEGFPENVTWPTKPS